jgi:holin-like protein
VPRLQACNAGLDGTQKGCVSQPGACSPAKPVLRPLLEKYDPHACHFVCCAAPQGGRCACGLAKPVPRPLLEKRCAPTFARVFAERLAFALLRIRLMEGLRGLAWLLAFQSAGELLSRGLHLPFPGPVIGMILMLPALHWRVVREPVSVCADFLLSHLSLLFVPVGVGVMTHLSLVSQYGVRILAVLVTAMSLHLLQRRIQSVAGNESDPRA